MAFWILPVRVRKEAARDGASCPPARKRLLCGQPKRAGDLFYGKGGPPPAAFLLQAERDMDKPRLHLRVLLVRRLEQMVHHTVAGVLFGAVAAIVKACVKDDTV